MRKRLREYLPDRDDIQLPALPSRPTLTEKQRLAARILAVAALMVIGATGIMAGLPILALQIMAGSILGIVAASLSISTGAAFVFAGYIWFILDDRKV